MALSDNLVAYWPLDEASGNALDAHSTNDLTDVNTVGAATGKVNGGRDFEANTDEAFTIANNAELSIADTTVSYTFTCWINPESLSSNGQVITKRSGALTGDGLEYMLRLDGDSPRLYWGREGTESQFDSYNPGHTLSTATWYFIAFGYDASTDKFFFSLDGAASTSTVGTFTNQTVGGGNPFQLGRTNGEGYDGIIDEVGFWKRRLTDEEIAELYNSGNGRDYDYITGAGGGVKEGAGTSAGVAAVVGVGQKEHFTTGNSAGAASAAGVGANANAGERETVGTSTGQASVVGIGQSEVFTVGNSTGTAAASGVGQAIVGGQGVGTAAGIATVSGVASAIVGGAGSSSGTSTASGVNDQEPVVVQRIVVGAGGELTWEDHVKAIHEMRMLENRVREEKKELTKVVKQIKKVEKQYKAEKSEGILSNLHKLEMKKDEIENKIQALEVDLEPLIMAIEKWEIEEDDNEFMSLQ